MPGRRFGPLHCQHPPVGGCRRRRDGFAEKQSNSGTLRVGWGGRAATAPRRKASSIRRRRRRQSAKADIAGPAAVAGPPAERIPAGPTRGGAGGGRSSATAEPARCRSTSTTGRSGAWMGKRGGGGAVVFFVRDTGARKALSGLGCRAPCDPPLLPSLPLPFLSYSQHGCIRARRHCVARVVWHSPARVRRHC